MNAIVPLVLCLALTPGLAAAQAKGSNQPQQTDYSNAPACAAVPGDDAPLICNCPGGGTNGSVWGSGPYTADSDICTAARHAGAIGAEGGPLQLTRQLGQDSYSGTSQNGVSTGDWGSYGQSFAVASVMQASAAPILPACGQLPGDADTLTCSCTANISGSVWGSGPYTADSNICSAARHAGYIEAEGGEVIVLRVPGLAAYTGSDFNGETTGDWGSYDASIIFNWN